MSAGRSETFLITTAFKTNKNKRPPLQRPPAPSFAQAPTPALQAARFDLADELGQILIARWRSKDAFDGAFWDEPVWTRALILLGGSLHAVGEAADSAWQGLVELARFGRLVVQQVGEGLQFSLEKAAALSGADFHAAAQALQRLRIDGIDSVQALYAQAERGLEMLHALLADPPSAALLSDFLLGYAHSTSYVEQRTGVVKTVAVIGIEVLIALAAGAVSLGVGTAVASARLAQRIGPFTAKAIELLRELYEKLRAFNRRKANYAQEAKLLDKVEQRANIARSSSSIGAGRDGGSEAISINLQAARPGSQQQAAERQHYSLSSQLKSHQSTSLPENFPKNIHDGQQGKHIPGHNNYIPGRSPLYPNVDPVELLRGVHSGHYPIIRMTPRGLPVVDFGSSIGEYNGVSTHYGIIHYSAKGAHVVPANPIQY